MEIKFRKYRHIIVLDLIGEFDLYNTTLLLDSIKRLRKMEIKHVVINLANVSYIDSSGIGSLIKIHSNQQSEGGKLFISGASENIAKVFEHAGLDDYFNLESNVNSAIRKFLVSDEAVPE